jgi:hypothetical protein
MRKILLGAFVAFGFAAVAIGGDPVWLQPYSDSSYRFAHSTISVSSFSVTTVPAAGRWREVYVGEPTASVSVFYRVDGSTQNIPTVGSWIEAGKEKRIESNDPIYFQLGAAASAVTLRLTTVQIDTP